MWKISRLMITGLFAFLMATCVHGPGSARAMVDAMYGRAPIAGRLPVSLDETHVRGSGLSRDTIAKGSGPPIRKYDFSRAFAVLDSAIGDKITPGAQVYISQGGVTLVDTGVGRFTYKPDAPPVTTESIYDLASLTKVLVGATVAMRLVEGRYMLLDEPIRNYFPAFRGRWKEQVTLRHLLTHSSGLPWYEKYWELDIKPEEVLDTIINAELTFQPGTDYVYSDLGLILFTALVELTTGKKIDQLAREWVFEPLQMEHTGYKPPVQWLDSIVPTEVFNDNLRRGLTRGTVHDRNTYFLGGISSHAGVFAPANQLAKLGHMYLDGGLAHGERLVQRETIAEFIRPQEMPPDSGRALAWQMASATASAGDLFSPLSFGHTGFTGTSIWIDPERELVVVLFTNRVHPSRERGDHKGIRQAFHNEVVRAVDPTASPMIAKPPKMRRRKRNSRPVRPPIPPIRGGR